MTDYKEFAKQMRENAVKNEQGNIVCSPELWEEIASVIEKAIIPPCKVGDKVYSIDCDFGIIEEYTVFGYTTKNGELALLVRSGIYTAVISNWFLTKEEAEEKLKELKK